LGSGFFSAQTILNFRQHRANHLRHVLDKFIQIDLLAIQQRFDGLAQSNELMI